MTTCTKSGVNIAHCTSKFIFQLSVNVIIFSMSNHARGMKNTIIIDVFSEHMSSKTLFRLGARGRALFPGAVNRLVRTPWCPRSNRVLVRPFSARHFVCCIVRDRKEA